ncbi:TetR/AcrR family transcriptional regulator [Candidatus Cryosericum septentrionale]|jgi:AcrR family transcriptional regulator|uniref:TetR/AcrR family transcriptional regulator n=1 Tax=Candidatus Cryosericum septentrionale TaxID=2290913 RepID=A0A398DL96_9BACT|nr:TetR/AcrR family transcriptional regulator [Candidatus Cryosericum septentrionale]RIE16342.1 TetR/AcrR family transcriptional regulator [Candidatus Cryosericum septentrionale]
MTQKQEQDALSRRDRRIERRQEEILQAAASVFAAKGYAQATTREIAAAADIAEGSLYNYFASKRDILVAIISRSPSPVDRLWSEAQNLADRDGFIGLVERALLAPASEQPWIRTVIKEAWTDDELFRQYQAGHVRETVAHVARLIECGIEAGWLRKVDPERAAQALVGALMASMMPLLRLTRGSEEPAEREQAARATADLLLFGLMMPEGGSHA